MREGRIIATGYNGTPRGFPRCNEEERGCMRCADRERYGSGSGYDVCICVHAEQNALLQAARLGYSADGAACYTTLQPCFGCLKELHQAGVTRGPLPQHLGAAAEPARSAYQRLIGDLGANGVRVAQLALPERLLDLRGA